MAHYYGLVRLARDREVLFWESGICQMGCGPAVVSVMRKVLYVCMCVCMYVCMCGRLRNDLGPSVVSVMRKVLYVCMCVYVCVCMCMHVCVYVCVCVCVRGKGRGACGSVGIEWQ
jgi:hypothetical protein